MPSSLRPPVRMARRWLSRPRRATLCPASLSKQPKTDPMAPHPATSILELLYIRRRCWGYIESSKDGLFGFPALVLLVCSQHQSRIFFGDLKVVFQAVLGFGGSHVIGS